MIPPLYYNSYSRTDHFELKRLRIFLKCNIFPHPKNLLARNKYCPSSWAWIAFGVGPVLAVRCMHDQYSTHFLPVFNCHHSWNKLIQHICIKTMYNDVVCFTFVFASLYHKSWGDCKVSSFICSVSFHLVCDCFASMDVMSSVLNVISIHLVVREPVTFTRCSSKGKTFRGCSSKYLGAIVFEIFGVETLCTKNSYAIICLIKAWCVILLDWSSYER